jgi:FkbM family methyltransferase
MMVAVVGAAVLFAAFLAAGVIATVVVLRHKHQQIWLRLWHLEAKIEEQRDALISVRKEQVLSSIDDLRLAPRMPSQHGEDIVLWRYFKGRRNGFFIEIGAYDGVTFSNTYLLEAVGWQGILVEANPDCFEECVRARPYSRCVQAAIVGERGQDCTTLTVPIGDGGVDALAFTEASEQHRQRIAREAAHTREIKTRAMTIDELLDGYHGPIDLISIDIETAELAALHGMDIARWAPELFIIEDNSIGSDRRVSDYLAQFGYIERLRLSANVFYVRAADDSHSPQSWLELFWP